MDDKYKQLPQQNTSGASPRNLAEESIQRSGVSDLPSVEDAIGIKPYVDAIAEFLTDERTRPPVTLSIEGEWGAGKSSFMRQLELVLRKKYGKKTVQFNAWRHDKDEALWASFAMEFARQILPRRTIPRLMRRLRLSWRRFDLVRGLPSLARLSAGGLALILLGIVLVRWLGGAGPVPEWLRGLIDAFLAVKAWALALVGVLYTVPMIQKLVGFLGNPFQLDLNRFVKSPDYRGRLPFLEQFHRDFAMVVDVYVEPDVDKVFVFVDDLDRCEVSRAAELVQALNLMIPEESKLIFILGMDRDMVAAGVAQRHSSILPMIASESSRENEDESVSPSQALAFGHAFLERFIQVPFRLPKMGESSLAAFGDSIMNDPALLEERRRERARTGLAEYDRIMAVFSYGAVEPQPAMVVEPADADSRAVREIVAMIAPALDSNPRKLKQFLNVFRLKAFLASRLGQFDVLPGVDNSAALTLMRLAKIVALELWWPRLLNDAEKEAGLIHKLEILGMNSGAAAEKNSQAVRYWSAQDGVIKLLSVGLRAGGDIGKLDLRRLRQVAPRLRREGMNLNWQRRASGPRNPPRGMFLSRLLKAMAFAAEGEAAGNLISMYTGIRTQQLKKDGYDLDFRRIGFEPVGRRDGSRPPVPSQDWIGGANFIYTVEPRDGGSSFYGYALGVSGSVKGVEYEIRPDGDWEGRPRRIAPAVVDSEVYKTLSGYQEKWHFTLRYPATFVERDGAIGAFEYRLVAKDASARMVVRSYEGGEWKQLCGAASNPPAASGKQILERRKKRSLLLLSGYDSGMAFFQAVVRQNGVLVEIELACDVKAMTGYARVLRKIISSVDAARKGSLMNLLRRNRWRV